ncbi:MAG: GNAT family N-acetyltransferase [Oscillatoriales cyanobacterium SM2_1_8]|nr:GNAT family N-acetyltransferase [Oscillatoriales cyanobacterium SM2_1_8]
MQISSVGIIPLPLPQRPAAAQLMAETFYDDPLAGYLVPDTTRRLPALQELWQHVIENDAGFEEIYTTGDRLEGVAVWVPPGMPTGSFVGTIALAVKLCLRTGWGNTYRFATTFSQIEAWRERDCPAPHWYLDGLAVSPQSQGRGIGSALLWPILARADRDGRSCYLFTSTDRAVRFYQRQGFEVCQEVRIGDDAPRLWTMRRSPQEEP